MKIVAIFLCHKRYEFFALTEIFDPEKYEFHIVAQPDFVINLTEQEKRCFSNVTYVEKLTESVICHYIDDLKSKGCSVDNIRLICLDEIRLLMVGKIRDIYGIPGLSEQAAHPYRDKLTMKAMVHDHDLRVPKFLALDPKDSTCNYSTIASIVGNHFIIKPALGVASIDTLEICNESQFQQWKSTADINATYDAEEFIHGALYICDKFIHHGEVIFTSVSEYTNPCMEFIHNKNMGVMLLHANDLTQSIKSFDMAVTKALGMSDGAFHGEYFVNDNGEIILLEIGLRPGGAHLIEILNATYGVNLYQLSLMQELNIPIIMQASISPKYYYAFCYFPLNTADIRKVI